MARVRGAVDRPRRRLPRRRCGSDIHLPHAVHPNGVWSYDLVHDRTADGRMLKLLCILDECTRESLAIESAGPSVRRVSS
jgi:hypothetical protein